MFASTNNKQTNNRTKFACKSKHSSADYFSLRCLFDAKNAPKNKRRLFNLRALLNKQRKQRFFAHFPQPNGAIRAGLDGPRMRTSLSQSRSATLSRREAQQVATDLRATIRRKEFARRERCVNKKQTTPKSASSLEKRRALLVSSFARHEIANSEFEACANQRTFRASFKFCLQSKSRLTFRGLFRCCAKNCRRKITKCLSLSCANNAMQASRV